ncbi:hypothetical protein Ciccas_014288 [Cichlidogyrus casuarinus]|uniref:Uncharacterized protein n=1 Tax=Cichlidogyrus casuarinus TaxID=1844966 RepID=A0ABD2PII9_9PLAT
MQLYLRPMRIGEMKIFVPTVLVFCVIASLKESSEAFLFNKDSKSECNVTAQSQTWYDTLNGVLDMVRSNALAPLLNKTIILPNVPVLQSIKLNDLPQVNLSCIPTLKGSILNMCLKLSRVNLTLTTNMFKNMKDRQLSMKPINTEWEFAFFPQENPDKPKSKIAPMFKVAPQKGKLILRLMNFDITEWHRPVSTDTSLNILLKTSSLIIKNEIESKLASYLQWALYTQARIPEFNF